jgi:MFS family permease
MIRRKPIYYGWVILAALSITEPVSWGILYYAITVFFKPMETEFGWSRSELTGAFSLSLLIAGVAGVPVGRLLDRRGPRWIMTAGSIGATLLVFAWSRVHSLTAFYAIWAGIGLAASAVLYEPAFVAVANWFARHRSKALTMLTFGGGWASVIFIPLSAWLVSAHGWRTALVVLAVILGITTIPLHAFVLRRRPADLGLEIDGAPFVENEAVASSATIVRGVAIDSALRHSSFWWLSLGFFLILLANVATTIHFIPLLTERGFSSGFAALAAGAIGLMALPGRLLFTPLGGRIDRRFVTALIFGLQAIAMIVLLQAHSRAMVWLFVAVFGAGFGAITPARASLVAEIYGPRDYGAISGLLGLFTTAARALAPVGASLLHDRSGGYHLVVIVFFALSAAAAGSILCVRPIAHVLDSTDTSPKGVVSAGRTGRG